MQVSTIGLDLAKSVFQVHGVDASGTVVVRRRLRRGQVLTYFAGLEACLRPLALELQADEVRLTGPAAARAIQLLADDPDADPEAAGALRALGFGSCLTLPITYGGEIVGHLEVYAVEQRPWSRFQIGRARVLGYQLGALVHRFTAAPDAV